jgi:hypothetical protein
VTDQCRARPVAHLQFTCAPFRCKGGHCTFPRPHTAQKVESSHSRYTRIWMAGIVLILSACSSPADRASTPRASAVAPAPSQSVAGGCAGTVVNATTMPPAWARSGFTISSGSPEYPWALGKPAEAVAYLFAIQLVAGGNRPDHSNNKVLWVTREPPEGLRMRSHPFGRSEPQVVISGQITNGNQVPSIVDVPTPGCWVFDMSWGQPTKHTSTINLDVLPEGTSPVRPTR